MLRFNALTGFRCLAACLVFFYHNRKYWRDQLHPEILRLFNEFHIGVALFFVLSGFLIAYTYAEEPMRSGKAYARYMLLRLARIMPLYWLVLTAFYLDPAFGKGRFSFLTYSLFHGFSDKHNLVGIAQAWSLNVEMTFYFFAPLLCLLQRKHLLYLLGSLIFLFGISWGAGEVWHRINGNPDRFFYPLKFISNSIFPGRCTEFLAGMLLAAALRNKQTAFLEKMPYKTWIGFLGILVAAYGSGLFQLNRYDYGFNHTGGMLLQKIVLPFFVLLLLAGLIYERTWLQWFFASRLLVLLGNASFAFYLVHISYVSIKLRQYIQLPDRNFILLWLISIAGYLVFEKPVYNWCRKRLKG
ncbi:MAG TPA: acyltransferase [Ferruginibacter sp.]|nr:acyltransferase [Ferruginibacter sp.]